MQSRSAKSENIQDKEDGEFGFPKETREVFLGNLHPDTTEEDIEQLLVSTKKPWDGLRLHIKKDSPTGKKYCFVLVENQEACDRMIEALYGSRVHGDRIIVSEAGKRMPQGQAQGGTARNSGGFGRDSNFETSSRDSSFRDTSFRETSSRDTSLRDGRGDELPAPAQKQEQNPHEQQVLEDVFRKHISTTTKQSQQKHLQPKKPPSLMDMESVAISNRPPVGYSSSESSVPHHRFSYPYEEYSDVEMYCENLPPGINHAVLKQLFDPFDCKWVQLCEDYGHTVAYFYITSLQKAEALLQTLNHFNFYGRSLYISFSDEINDFYPPSMSKPAFYVRNRKSFQPPSQGMYNHHQHMHRPTPDEYQYEAFEAELEDVMKKPMKITIDSSSERRSVITQGSKDVPRQSYDELQSRVAHLGRGRGSVTATGHGPQAPHGRGSSVDRGSAQPGVGGQREALQEDFPDFDGVEEKLQGLNLQSSAPAAKEQYEEPQPRFGNEQARFGSQDIRFRNPPADKQASRPQAPGQGPPPQQAPPQKARSPVKAPGSPEKAPFSQQGRGPQQNRDQRGFRDSGSRDGPQDARFRGSGGREGPQDTRFRGSGGRDGPQDARYRDSGDRRDGPQDVRFKGGQPSEQPPNYQSSYHVRPAQEMKEMEKKKERGQNGEQGVASGDHARAQQKDRGADDRPRAQQQDRGAGDRPRSQQQKHRTRNDKMPQLDQDDEEFLPLAPANPELEERSYERVKKAPAPAPPAQMQARSPQAQQPRGTQPQAQQPRGTQPQAQQPRGTQLQAQQPRAEQPQTQQPRADQAPVRQPRAEQPPQARQPAPAQPKSLVPDHMKESRMVRMLQEVFMCEDMNVELKALSDPAAIRIIQAVFNHGYFWATIASQAVFEELTGMMEVFKDPESSSHLERFKHAMLRGVALYEGDYARVWVEEELPNNKIKVFFIDWGNTEVIPHSDFLFLQGEMSEVVFGYPPMVVPCKAENPEEMPIETPGGVSVFQADLVPGKIEEGYIVNLRNITIIKPE